MILKSEQSPRKSHIFFTQAHPAAIRLGDYKLHFASTERTRSPGIPNDPIKGSGAQKYDPPILFNLKNDISEKNNIADKHPELLETMKKMYFQKLKDLKENVY